MLLVGKYLTNLNFRVKILKRWLFAGNILVDLPNSPIFPPTVYSYTAIQ